MIEPHLSSGRAHLQFSLRSMLIITTGVSVFFGLFVAGWHSAAFWCLAGSGICMMVVDLVLGRGRRSWTGGLLLIGICYAAANIALFEATMSIDPFAIFDLIYIVTAAFGAPGLTIIASVVVAARSRRVHWRGLLGFSIWIGKASITSSCPRST